MPSHQGPCGTPGGADSEQFPRAECRGEREPEALSSQPLLGRRNDPPRSTALSSRELGREQGEKGSLACSECPSGPVLLRWRCPSRFSVVKLWFLFLRGAQECPSVGANGEPLAQKTWQDLGQALGQVGTGLGKREGWTCDLAEAAVSSFCPRRVLTT